VKLKFISITPLATPVCYNKHHFPNILLYNCVSSLIVALLFLVTGCKKDIYTQPINNDEAVSKTSSSTQETTTLQSNVFYFGDSITSGVTSVNGTGTVTDKNWAALLSADMGWTCHNLGIPGTTMVKSVNGNIEANSMYSRAEKEIPQKRAKDKYLFFAYGINDVLKNYDDVSTAQFKEDYQYVLNVAFARGWKPQDIVLLNGYYCLISGYAIYNIAPFADRNRHMAFNSAIKTVADSNKTRFIDIYGYMQNNGGDTLLIFDGIHPTLTGYNVIAQGVKKVINSFQ
jgi:lysophospholipase L1-like esterase